MVNELDMIQKLEHIAQLIANEQSGTAVNVIESMVYDLCVQVQEFESQFEMEFEMDDGA
jgi:hypothetical protein|tara:strand:+ start:682 stop:858 length:177 start_codon:yes stop_codon:yes gene_type:complete